MTSGDDVPTTEEVTRRGLLRATVGLTAAGVGLNRIVGRNEASQDEVPDAGRDVVAFCGPDAVCASTGGIVVIGDRSESGWSFRRRPMAGGFCLTIVSGAVVAVEVGGEHLHNTAAGAGDAVAAYLERDSPPDNAPSTPDTR